MLPMIGSHCAFIRGARRSRNHTQLLCLKHGVEGVTILSVAVTQQCAVTCRRLVPCSRNASAYRRRIASPRRRIDNRAAQDLPDRRGAQAMTKPNQLAMDPPMSPPRIIFGESKYKRLDRRCG
jgi:hypothetical protein